MSTGWIRWTGPFPVKFIIVNTQNHNKNSRLINLISETVNNLNDPIQELNPYTYISPRHNGRPVKE